jgi:hypothetical protein
MSGRTLVAEKAIYLFAVARDLDPVVLAEQPGIHGAPVHVLDHRGLQAITCRVDLNEFGEDALRRNLERLPWLEEIARAHDAVVHTAASAATTAPIRLVTICSTETSVRARLDEWFEGLQRALDRVEGCQEWSIKAFAPGDGAPDDAGTDTPPSTGAAYLQRRRTQLAARAQGAQRAAEIAEAIHRDASNVVRASRRLAPQDPRLSGFPETMILNGAYLVADDQASLFEELIAHLQIEYADASVDVRGPWPPYSFATLD